MNQVCTVQHGEPNSTASPCRRTSDFWLRSTDSKLWLVCESDNRAFRTGEKFFTIHVRRNHPEYVDGARRNYNCNQFVLPQQCSETKIRYRSLPIWIIYIIVHHLQNRIISMETLKSEWTRCDRLIGRGIHRNAWITESGPHIIRNRCTRRNENEHGYHHQGRRLCCWIVETGLQYALTILELYCCHWVQNIYLDKTKLMIFNKSGTLLQSSTVSSSKVRKKCT